MARGFDGYYAAAAQGKQGVAVLLGKHNIDLTGDAKESRASVGDVAYNADHGIPETNTRPAAFDSARLPAMRRAAAALERPERGVHLRITDDGKAIATGPKNTRIPERFVKFAADNGLTFLARRYQPSPGNGNPANIGPRSTYSAPMPVEYREAGALYFNEMGEAWLDRTGKEKFSRQHVSPTPVSRSEKLSAMRERARQMLGSDSRTVTFVDQLFSLKDGSPISGTYARDMIIVAMNSVDGLGTLNHEAAHHAMEVYFTKAQQEVLRSAFKPSGKLAGQVRAALESDGQAEVAADTDYLSRDDEYITFGFQYWKDGKVEFKGQVGQLFKMFSDFLERVHSWMKGAGFNTAEDLFKALDEGKLAGKRAEPAPKLEALFAESRAPVKSDVLDGFMRGNIAGIGDSHASMGVPAVLRSLGVEELPLVVADKVVSDKALFDHGIRPEQVRNLLDLLADPLAVLKSATVDGALVVVTDTKDRAGRQVVVAIHPGASVAGRVGVRTNKIASIYGRNDHQQFFARETKEGRVLHVNEKSPEKLRALGLQLPATGTSSQGAAVTIPDSPGEVKESRAKPGAVREEARAYKERQQAKPPAKAKPKSLLGNVSPAYERISTKIIDAIDNFLDPLGYLPDQADYLTERYRTLGAMARYEEIGKGVYDYLAKATKADAKAIYDYLTSSRGLQVHRRSNQTRASPRVKTRWRR